MTSERFRRDNARPTVAEAERLVLASLRATAKEGVVVSDARDRNRAGDIRVAYECLVDVKADHFIDRTGRIPFEWGDRFQDGRIRRTWGHDGVKHIVVVGTRSWRAWWVDVRVLAALVERRTDQFRRVPHGWKRAENDNGAYTTVCYAVPIQEVRAAGGIRHSWMLSADVAARVTAA